MDGIDLALVWDQFGGVMIHTAECPDARRAAAEGHPVATLLGCERMPDDSEFRRRHSCLEGLF